MRRISEFLLSLNLALAFVLHESIRGPFFVELRLQYVINDALHLHHHNNAGGYGAFFVLAMGLALCIFVLLRLASRLNVEGFLRSLGGVLLIAALPICALLIDNPDIRTALLEPDGRLLWPWFLACSLELLAAVVCVFLYLYRKWFFNSWQSIALLSVHWLFWGGYLFGPFFWRAPAQLAIVAVGLSSCLTWGFYVSQQHLKRESGP